MLVLKSYFPIIIGFLPLVNILLLKDIILSENPYFCRKENIIKQKVNKSLLILFILFGYVFLQLIWWAYHIIELNKLVTNDETIIHSKTMMIAGEAAVFILLLFVGLYFIRRSILKELALVHEKKNFSLSVTHELKTPIASTKLFVETLINRDLPREKEKDILRKVYSDQNRLQQLVEDILLVSKVDESTVKIRLTKVNVKVFITQVVKNMVGDNPVHIDINENLMMEVDEFYFSSVVQNLQSNAVKYSGKESPIIWEAKRKGNKLLIRIKDQGIGIKDQEKLSVFKLFYRSGNEETRKTKGTGIGLYLVARIIKLHKGRIKALDNKPKGTIIEVEF